MSADTWDTGTDSGGAFLERQHRELNALIKRLKAIGCDSRPHVLLVLDRLMDFVLDHFLLEEDLMRRCGYPPAAALSMSRQHEDFIERARRLVLALRLGESHSVEPLSQLLEEFRAVHEAGADLQLADWIRDGQVGAGGKA